MMKPHGLLVAHSDRGRPKNKRNSLLKGFKKGFDQYKKQQSARARELDKKHKKAKQKVTSSDAPEMKIQERIVHKQHWLPWLLLILTWLIVAVYWYAF